MAINELETFPQITLVEGQGLTGTRRWTIDAGDDTGRFLAILAKTHFPGYPDAIPIQIQCGGFWEGVNINRDSNTHPRTYETLGDLPEYGKTLVVAQYALHRMTNCWPNKIPRPWMPSGTTRSLKIRGSGQMLLITPAGTQHGALSPLFGCPENPTPGTEVAANSIPTRLIVPVTEYHVSCGRMTKLQVDEALGVRDWDDYQGCVNRYQFLGAPAGTLLFDGYEISETMACETEDPFRYTMTACFKQRVFTDHHGHPRKDAQRFAIGWNHDYIPVANTATEELEWDWHVIKIGKKCELRYSPMNFFCMFGGSGTQDCGQTTTGATRLGDCDLSTSGEGGGSESGNESSSHMGACGEPDSGSSWGASDGSGE